MIGTKFENLNNFLTRGNSHGNLNVLKGRRKVEIDIQTKILQHVLCLKSHGDKS